MKGYANIRCLEIFFIMVSYIMSVSYVQAMQEAGDDDPNKYIVSCSRAITKERMGESNAKASFKEDLIKFLKIFIREPAPSPQLVCSYVELLFRDAVLREEEDKFAMQTAYENAKRVIVTALESKRNSSVLLETLFRHFLPIGDEFALQTFEKYCTQLAKSRIEEIGRLYRGKHISKMPNHKDISEHPLIATAKNIRTDPLIAITIEVALDIVRPIVEESEISIRASISKIRKDLRLREEASHSLLLNRLLGEDKHHSKRERGLLDFLPLEE